MAKPNNEISRRPTELVCTECTGPIVTIKCEIEDGQGHGGTESTPPFLWCDHCNEEKQPQFGDVIPKFMGHEGHKVVWLSLEGYVPLFGETYESFVQASNPYCVTCKAKILPDDESTETEQ